MFLICGEALYDVFLESETPRGLRMDACLGGSPFNVAVGLARLSRRAGLLTGLSTDSLGHHLEKVLTDEGVETAFLARKDGPTTLAFVGVDSDGLTKYTFYGHGAADRSVTLDDLPEMPDARGPEGLAGREPHPGLRQHALGEAHGIHHAVHG